MKELYSKYISCGGTVTTDSRAIKGGEMFFALKGENFDGNDYALKALESGAAYAVVDENAGLPDDERLIKVADTLETLRDLAIYHRTHVRDGKLPVIGLTGTNGKTTTKELIAAVLSKKYNVCATQGNLNNDIGVPLSLLRITPETEIAVIEMGANHPDDIAKLVRVSQPDYGLITNVGKAHLLGFGSFEGVKAAKGELYKWLGSRRGNLIFINEDDKDLKEMSLTIPCHNFGYGIRYQGAEILPTSSDSPFLALRIGDTEIHTQLVGSYNANNVLAALAVGDYFGVDRKNAIAAIESYQPVNKRSQMVKTDRNTLIVDAYNANPSSMNAALDNFNMLCSKRKIAMLGDMRELGNDSVKEHLEIVKKLLSYKLDAYLVGEEFKKALDQLGADAEGFIHFENSEALLQYLQTNAINDAAILVKGSRGIEMERILPAL